MDNVVVTQNELSSTIFTFFEVAVYGFISMEELL